MTLLSNTQFMERAFRTAALRKQQRDTRRFDKAVIAGKIKERVIGQDVLADEIATEIYLKASRKERNRTLINFIISGPTGTGKTELAKAIAYAVFGDNHLLEIDCGTLGTSEHNLHALFGAPAVYRNASRGRVPEFLTRTRGSGVILFDEYEKAAPTEGAPLAKALLKLLDEGKIQSQYDMSDIDATSCIVILSSNLKQEEFAAAARRAATPRELDTACRAILTGSMSTEFLNRFSLVVSPAPLGDSDRCRIAGMMIDKLAQMHHIQIVDPRPGLEDLVAACAEKIEEIGVRQARNWLERTIEESFVEAANERHLKAVAADWDDVSLILSPDE